MEKNSKSDIEHAAENAVKIIADAVNKATGAIASAASEASKLIASNALDASKLVASNAVEAVKVLSAKSADGVSIEIQMAKLQENVTVNFAQIKEAINELKSGTTKRIDNLEIEKLNVRDSYPQLYKAENDRINADHEKRIRRTEQWGFFAIGALAILEFLFKFFVK